MIPVAANIPLTICSVVIRRFIDSYTGRLPLAVAASAAHPSATTMAFLSGAVICLYHQLRKGTLVNIGIGKRLSSVLKNSRHTIQRRLEANSWFLKNIAGSRRECTEAIFRIASQSNNSLLNVQGETAPVNETNSLPVFTRHNIQREEPPLENLYSNESFDSRDCSNPDLQEENLSRGLRRPVTNLIRRIYNAANRPITRNYRKCPPEDAGEDNSRNRKRKKPEHTGNELVAQVIPDTRIPPEIRTNKPRRQSRRLCKEILIPDNPASKSVNRRNSERIRKLSKVQKITRKTRSGRVYAYRL